MKHLFEGIGEAMIQPNCKWSKPDEKGIELRLARHNNSLLFLSAPEDS
jgi:hypothetical protein